MTTATPTPAPKKTSPRATRNKERLACELSDVRNEISHREEPDPAAAQAAAQRRTEVIETTAKTSVQDVVQYLSSIGLEAQGSLDALKNTMLSAVQDLENLRDAKRLLEEEIAELHGKEVLSASIKSLLISYDEKKRELEAAHLEQWEAYRTKLGALAKEAADYKEDTRITREREEEQYQYTTKQNRVLDEDTFAMERLQRERVLRDEEVSRYRACEMRELALREKEDEVALLRGKAEMFPSELEAAKKAAADAVAKGLHGEYGHKIAMIEANNKAEKGLAEQTIKSLQVKAADQDMVIKALQDKLERAEARVENIAKSALDSASGRHALEVSQATMAVARDGSTPAGRKS